MNPCLKFVFHFPNMEKCKIITREFLSKPFSVYFRTPVNPVDLQDYDKIVKKPMDLGTINSKLQKRYYNSISEWYDDMILVFQNAIDYFPIDDGLSMIARYQLAEFKKMAYGMNLTTEQDWLNSIQTISSKLTKIISQPPSLTKANPNISLLCQRAEKASPPDKQAIASYVQKLNHITVNDDVREEVIGILKEVQGMTISEITEQPVNLDNLKPVALKSLVLFANEHA